MTLNNIESNKINNTKSKMNLTHFIMLHIDQSFKYEYASSNFNFIIRF